MDNRCICCGEIIPEGRWLCWQCEHQYEVKPNTKEDKEDEV